MRKLKALNVSDPVHYVHSLADKISSNRTALYKSQYGQYFTPKILTDYILENGVINFPPKSFLDPAAGVGNLLVSLIVFCVQKFPNFYNGRTIMATAYEIDETLKKPLTECLVVLKKYLKEKYDCNLEFYVFIEDFVESTISFFERKNSLEHYLHDSSEIGEF